MKNLFDKNACDGVLERISQLEPTTEPEWGKMTVSQMLAHCNVAYEMTYEDKHPKPSGLKKWILKTFVKNMVVGDKPYKRNTRTASEFLQTEPKEFNREKDRLISYVERTQELGKDYFENRESHAFGKLNGIEWNNMFYKHLDHHLNQFGV